MCGIAGIFSFGGAPLERATLQRMCDRLAHRGPDGEGIWLSPDRKVGFGHRRLSIIDLSSAAAQPMANHDGSIQLVFNGEIFNHAEIRRELEREASYHWQTDHSDTEVIIHAYERWGIDCVHRFRGDFAIALWDGRERCLWLMRDRVGVKPLYYARFAGGIAFASEIKALFELPQVPRGLNEEALGEYLSFLTPAAPRTLFAGIEKLPCATRMRIRADGHVHTERYWDPLSGAARLTAPRDEGEASDAILEVLRTSVRYRQESDVPVGVFLSGGIDSGTNAVLFAESGVKVRTFSIGYDAQYESYPDELPYAQRVAHQVGAEHHVRKLTSRDVVGFIERMVYHQDEPIGDVVCVPLYYVAKLARDAGVIVCQVGEGSDELFCGYPFWIRHLQMARYDRWPVPRFARAAALAGLKLAGRGDSYIYELLRRSVRGEPLFWGGAEGLTAREKDTVLGEATRAAAAAHSPAEALRAIRARFDAGTAAHDSVEPNSVEPSALNWMTYLDLNLRLPELLLARVDKMTMATSVEGRVPYLDHRLIELAFAIPTRLKVQGTETKRLLKRAVTHLLPADLLNRRKQGFGLPMREWLSGDLGSELERRVGRFAESTGILSGRAREFVRTANWSKAWLLYNLAVWHERFIAGDARAPRDS